MTAEMKRRQLQDPVVEDAPEKDKGKLGVGQTGV